MPAGKVLRIDPGRQSVHIERRGRSQEAPLTEVEDFGIDVTPQAFRVVNVWVTAMSDGDLDGALMLYRPSAVVNRPGGTVSGPSAIVAALTAAGWPGTATGGIRLRGVDRFVLAEPVGGSALPPTAFLVEDGEIVEQWLGAEPTDEISWATGRRTADDGTPSEADAMVVARRGAVSDAAVDYAQEKVGHLVMAMGRPMLWGQVKLTHTSNPANEQPSMAEMTLDLDGNVTRAHAAAKTMPEAIDAAVDRLRAKFERLSDRYRHQPVGVTPSPGHWRHGNLPSPHAPYFEREPEEREIVRHKSFAPGRLGIDEALWDLALLDYDFFLFVEASTGADCVAERTEGDDVVVHGLADRPEAQATLARPGVVFSARPVPVLATSGAIALLDGSGERFEVFVNERSGRCNIVYRRYDGHYGLITPPVDDGTDSSARSGRSGPERSGDAEGAER